MVVGIQKELDVPAQVVITAVVISSHGDVLQRAVHAFDLTVGPRMVGPDQPVLDAMLFTGVAESVAAPGTGLLAGDPGCRGVLAAAFLRVGMGELDAVVR